MCLFSPLDSEKMNSAFALFDLRIYVSDLAVLILTNLAVLASWGVQGGAVTGNPAYSFGSIGKKMGSPFLGHPPNCMKYEPPFVQVYHYQKGTTMFRIPRHPSKCQSMSKGRNEMHVVFRIHGCIISKWSRIPFFICCLLIWSHHFIKPLFVTQVVLSKRSLPKLPYKVQVYS